MRHSTAHLLAQATQRLFPSAQVTIGPVVDNGFYYDFAFERAFTLDDLAAIEVEMAKIVAESLPVQRRKPFHWRAANPVTALRALTQLKGVAPLVGVVAFSGLAQFVLYTSWVLYTTFKFGRCGGRNAFECWRR